MKNRFKHKVMKVKVLQKKTTLRCLQVTEKREMERIFVERHTIDHQLKRTKLMNLFTVTLIIQKCYHQD